MTVNTTSCNLLLYALSNVGEKESAKNKETVADAKEAQTAVSQALTVLKEFYAKAAEATALVQQREVRAGLCGCRCLGSR